ncbi:MAG: SAM-dependent methyltransferase [Rhodocyclales bacterium]|nr:SAM-dependent methyltransferase [Rhodocyclales bacterium]
MPTGTLYLIPVSLGESRPDAILPAEALRIARGLCYFIVENAKSARVELKRIDVAHPIQDIDIRELPREPKQADLDALLAPLAKGESAGLMSEAGAPAVADPGAVLVRTAHTKGIRVAPLVGPSSLLLALMASGLNGQSFAFHGYLPLREPERSKRIAELERESRRKGRTQIFIETPYRNAALFAALLEACRPDTLLCTASELTTEKESITTKRIDAWRAGLPPSIQKRPTVFLLLAD